MKLRRTNFLFSIAPIATFLPFVVVSCSKTNGESVFASSDLNLYQSLWNASFTTFIDNEGIKNSIYSLKISEFEKIINDEISRNAKTKKVMQVYAFFMLWQSINNPYSRDGKKVSILSEDLKKYSDFLSEIIRPDDSSADKKTYKNMNKFIESIDNVKINLLPFIKNQNNNEILIDKEKTVGEIISNKNTWELLNFQFEFKINNDKANELILQKDDNKKHIFYKTKLEREEKKIILKYNNNSNIKDIIFNQFNYQGTKMYYDIESKTFKTIVLSNNIRNKGNINTKPSGFIDQYDTKRNLFFIDFKKLSDKKYQQNLILNLSNSNYFDINLSSNFKNYLEEQKIIENNSMKNIEFNLFKITNYEPIKENEKNKK